MKNFKSSESIVKNVPTRDKSDMRIRDALMDDLFKPNEKEF